MTSQVRQAAPQPAATEDDAPDRREIRAVILGLMIVLGLGAIDQSIVATALPRIVSDLGGVTHLSWVVSAYVLASTSTMPLYGKLSDQYGRKPMIYTAILIFLLGSVLSGMAQTLLQLIIFRAIQGLGAGGLLPLAQIIIGDLVPPARRGRNQGSIAAVFAVCSVIGPILGGVITDLLSWHWIFYVNLPIGAVALVMIGRALKRRHQVRSRRIDYLGAVLLTGCTTSFLLALALGGNEWAWNSPQILGLAAAALVLGIFFVFHIRREPEPVLPPDLFRNRLFIIACLVLALTFMGMLGATLFFPLFFQMVMGVTPSHSGFLTGPLMIGFVISSMLNGRVLLQRSGRYKPAQLCGLGLATAAFATLAWAIATSKGFAIIEPPIFALGLGLGLVMPTMTVAVQNALPLAHRGVGTATLAFFRSLGGLIGVTGSGAILAYRVRQATGSSGSLDLSSLTEGGLKQLAAASPEDHAAAIALYRHAIAMTFATGTVIVALALIALLFLPELPLKMHHGEGAQPPR
ncbi:MULTISPECIES: MDR family MFS transporter [Rhizobium]|uniref:EmrB/QacA subfamily drug resistance transporter n=1 Tax=Rhizobium paranaense TaxID=1650438 RepID=A0A7W8XTA3_9HYPH|nr:MULTISPECIES: MDR family MFS transporter [Rhizobium]MBB5575111.1 EmrB/QacA subfamily drug resistance transporter [Rhizobium paranaense]PST64457.1 MFS transporter [Rhizobium sp. SEMIA4064]